ncbi:MAG: archease [Dictyoglomi bacterium]|nr:archease [Dictyoglomota bacterium]
MRVEIKDHTADALLAVEGHSLEEIIEGFIIGLSDYVWGNTDCDDVNIVISLSGDGPDMTFALVSLLSDLLYLIETDNIKVVSLEDIAYSRRNSLVNITVRIKACKGKHPTGEDVKAVSFSMRWDVSVILDL